MTLLSQHTASNSTMKVRKCLYVFVFVCQGWFVRLCLSADIYSSEKKNSEFRKLFKKKKILCKPAAPMELQVSARSLPQLKLWLAICFMFIYNNALLPLRCLNILRENV